jgi:hypothetical protein
MSVPPVTLQLLMMLLLLFECSHLTAYYGTGGEPDPVKARIEAAVRAAYSSPEYTVQHIALTLTLTPPVYFTRTLTVQPYEPAAAESGGLTHAVMRWQPTTVDISALLFAKQGKVMPGCSIIARAFCSDDRERICMWIPEQEQPDSTAVQLKRMPADRVSAAAAVIYFEVLYNTKYNSVTTTRLILQHNRSAVVSAGANISTCLHD